MPKPALEQIDEAKRRRIYDVAASEFAANGYARANINEIAIGAGIGKGSIYLYFESKKDLYLATAMEGVRLVEAMWREALADIPEGDFFTAVERGIRVAMRFAQNHRDYYRMYAHATYGGHAEFKDELYGLIRVFLGSHVRPLVEAAQRRGVVRAVDPTLAAFFYFTSAIAFQDALIDPALFPGVAPEDGETAVTARIREYLDLLRNGLGAGAATGTGS